MAEVAIVGGQNTGSGKQRTETFGNDRRCADPGCRAKLSIYNPSDTCTTHPTSIVRLTSPSKGAQKSLESLLSS